MSETGQVPTHTRPVPVQAEPTVTEKLREGLKRARGLLALGRGRLRDEEQLLSIVDRAAEQELLEEDDRDYIHSLVSFSDTYVRELMVPRVDMITLPATETVHSALEELLASRHSRIPVIGDAADDVVGVVYLRDASGFVLRRPEEALTAPVTRITKPAQFVPELQRADELLRQMQREANHLAIVVDEYGGVSGLVTLEDIIEELLGDINDEHDREAPEVQPRDDGSFLVSARLPVDELGELFDTELSDDDVDTVGGLFSKLLGRLPVTGDEVQVAGICLRAAGVERRRQRLLTAVAYWVGVDEEES